jgi:hypothetical protein
VTAVIGSGVLSLAWSIAKLGWILGPATLLVFAIVTYFSSSLLADCYRAPAPSHGGGGGGELLCSRRNYTYMEAVRSNLGKGKTSRNRKESTDACVSESSTHGMNRSNELPWLQSFLSEEEAWRLF